MPLIIVQYSCSWNFVFKAECHCLECAIVAYKLCAIQFSFVKVPSVGRLVYAILS